MSPARLLPGLVLLVSITACRQTPVPVPGPDSASAAARPLIIRGDVRAGAADPESAVRFYREAIDADPESVPAHIRYVSRMLALGRGSQVRAEYTERAGRPGASDAEQTLSERLSTNGSSSALRRVYTNAASRAPSSPWWYLALVEVEVAEADAWNERRLEAQERGDHDKETKAHAQAESALERAERALSRAAQRGPDLAEVSLYRGYVRATEGDVEAAAAARRAAYTAAGESFLRATRMDVDLVEAWGGLGDVRYRAGDKQGALRAFREAVRRAPADPAYRESLGVALHDAERYLEAARQYRQAAALRPWDATPLVRLGDALADAERWTAALDAYASALRRDPEAIKAHYMTGVVLEYLERPAEARAAFERYVELDGPKASSVRRRIDRLLREEQR